MRCCQFCNHYNDCGSTSTTAFTPALRIAGAAAASTCPARAASARGRSVFATSWARWRPRSRSSGAGPSSCGAVQPAAQLAQQLLRRGRVRAGGDDRDQVAEGRVAELASPLELLGEEAGDVVPRRVAQRRRVGLERLHDHLPRRVAAAAAGELRHELERALLGPEVGQREPGVGVDDGGERDAREVVALGDHLRSDQHRPVGGGEAIERLAERTRLGGRVRVEPDPLELGDALRELRLEPLRARPDPSELGRAAGRARLGNGLRVAAVVAVQRVRRRAASARRRRDRTGGRARRRGSGSRARARAG